MGKISPRPIFFIHGDHDQYLPDFDELYAAARQPKELWRLPDAGHTTASQLYPEEHARRVIEFFKRLPLIFNYRIRLRNDVPELTLP